MPHRNRWQRRLGRQFEARNATYAVTVAAAKATQQLALKLRVAPRSGRLQRHIPVEAGVRDHRRKKNARQIGNCYGRVAMEAHRIDFTLRSPRIARTAGNATGTVRRGC